MLNNAVQYSLRGIIISTSVQIRQSDTLLQLARMYGPLLYSVSLYGLICELYRMMYNKGKWETVNHARHTIKYPFILDGIIYLTAPPRPPLEQFDLPVIRETLLSQADIENVYGKSVLMALEERGYYG